MVGLRAVLGLGLAPTQYLVPCQGPRYYESTPTEKGAATPYRFGLPEQHKAARLRTIIRVLTRHG
jgi:hypothetical protein